MLTLVCDWPTSPKGCWVPRGFRPWQAAVSRASERASLTSHPRWTSADCSVTLKSKSGLYSADSWPGRNKLFQCNSCRTLFWGLLRNSEFLQDFILRQVRGRREDSNVIPLAAHCSPPSSARSETYQLGCTYLSTKEGGASHDSFGVLASATSPAFQNQNMLVTCPAPFHNK